MTSLFERLGGAPALDSVVESFYRKVLVDERISAYFDDVDMEAQLAKQKAFLTMVLGGPTRYTGKDMRAGHAHLVARGMNDGHVDAVIELLGKTLTEHGVAAADVAKVASIADSVRDDVLGRRPKS